VDYAVDISIINFDYFNAPFIYLASLYTQDHIISS